MSVGRRNAGQPAAIWTLATTSWPLALAAATVILLFATSWWSMVQIWSQSATYGHQFLIPPIAAYLAWRRRARLAEVVQGVSVLGLPVALAGCGVWYVGFLVDANLLMHAALVLLVHAVILLAGGWIAVGVDNLIYGCVFFSAISLVIVAIGAAVLLACVLTVQDAAAWRLAKINAETAPAAVPDPPSPRPGRPASSGLGIPGSLSPIDSALGRWAATGRPSASTWRSEPASVRDARP